MITIPTPFITCENWLMVNDAWIDVPNIIIVLSILSFYVLPSTVQQRNSRQKWQKSCFLSVCPINYFISMHQNWMLHNTYHFLVANFAIFEFKLTFLGLLRFVNDFGCLDIINGLCQKNYFPRGEECFLPTVQSFLLMKYWERAANPWWQMIHGNHHQWISKNRTIARAKFTSLQIDKNARLMVCTMYSWDTYKKEQVLKIHLRCILANALFPKCMKLVCISPMRLRILFHILSHQKIQLSFRTST